MKQEEGWDNEGHSVVHTFPLKAAPLEKSKRFKLSLEDPKYYKEEPGYDPPKEWPEPLPGMLGRSTTLEEIAIQQKVHDLQCKHLEGFGIDACRVYQQSKVQYVLEAITSSDKECPICHEQKADAPAVRAHIRAKHMDVTPFPCPSCDKQFGNNQLLRAHLKTHEDKNKFPCSHEDCKKSFPTLGRYNAHLKTHDPQNFVSCPYCGKVFQDKKNLPDHKKTCQQQPGGRQAASKDFKCEYCPKEYYKKKDLKYHLKHSHASRATQKS